MKSGHITTRPFAASLIAALSLLLSGCFIADEDDRIPIIPAETLAYPIKTGFGKQCEVDGLCENVEFVRRNGGGYEMWWQSYDEEYDEVIDEVSTFKMRRLQGEGIPADTYLVQLIDASPRQRYLSLLTRDANGVWRNLKPTCRFAAGNGALDVRPWVRVLDDDHCQIGRYQLTDARIYRTLSAAVDPRGTTLIYDPK